MKKFVRRLSFLFHRRQWNAELNEEMKFHRDMVEHDLKETGGVKTSGRIMGNMTLAQEDARSVWVGPWLDGIAVDVRQSLRSLRRKPGLTAMATIMLTLGIGATIVVFSVFYAALVQPLPFRDTARLFEIKETRIQKGWSAMSFTEANFWDLRALNRSFSEVAAVHWDQANLTGAGTPEKVSKLSVTAGFFRVLGVSPILGRDFSYDDERPGGNNQVVILGNKFWKNRFAADPNILGKTLRLDGKPFLVAGVLPPGEPWIDDQTYVPFVRRTNANRGSFEYGVVARLAPGISAQTARADLRRIGASLARDYPRDDAGIGFQLDPSAKWIADDSTRRALWVLLAAVGFLLMIACFNLANLLLARATTRAREIAVRTALGASRARLVRLLFTESMLLSLFGAALGLLLAKTTLDLIKVLDIPGIPRVADAGLNTWVISFAALTAVLTGVLSGIAPALQAPSGCVGAALRDGDRTQAGGRTQSRLRSILVTCEVALSFILLVGAGLLARSFTEMLHIERGFQTGNRLLFTVNMPPSYWEKGTGKQFIDRFLERISALPQVVSPAAITTLPLANGDSGMGIGPASPSEQASRQTPWASWRMITPAYFKAIGLPLLKGRSYTPADQIAKPWRVIVSERLAKLLYPNQDAVGRRALLWKGQGNFDAEIVGVVGDMRERGLSTPPNMVAYLPYGDEALPGEFVVHTAGSPLALTGAIRSILAGLDPNLPMSDVRTFDDAVGRSVSTPRFNAVLLAIFSAIALLLATTGIYGVLSYWTNRRTPEIGLRLALGASSRSILEMTIGQGMRPVLLGILLGAGGAFWLSRFLSTLLFGVQPFDLPTYAAVAVVLLATALLSCYLPARRGMRVDPMTALRTE